MTFIIKEDYSFTWPVRVCIPADGGRFDKKVFNVTFKVIDQDRINDLLGGGDSALLRDVVTGWSKYGDIKGNEILFSEAECDRLLKIPYVRSAMIKTFLEAMNGIKGTSL